MGTSKALIFAFDMHTKKARLFSKGRNLEYERVDTVCVSDNGEFVIAGYAMGQVTIWDLNKFEDVKTIIGVFITSVSLIRIINNDNYAFLAADPSGLLMQFAIVKGYFTTSIEQNAIYKSGSSELKLTKEKVIELEVEYLQFDRRTVVQMIFAATQENVTFILLHPIVQRVCSIGRPPEENSATNPSISYRQTLGSKLGSNQQAKVASSPEFCWYHGGVLFVRTRYNRTARVQESSTQTKFTQ